VLSHSSVDVLLGWYLLPYAVAAHNASRLTGIRYLVQHAGSDFKRLLGDRQLSTFLKRVILDAHGVMAYPAYKEALQRIGCRSVFVHAPPVASEFASDGEVMDLCNYFGLDLTPERTIVFLGKLSPGKGVDHLLKAFARVKTDGFLLFVGCGSRRRHYEEVVRDEGVKGVRFVDAVPPWRVPSLIRAVRAVVVPEWNFGVERHRSSIPLETVMCGKTAIVSRQVAAAYGPAARFFVTIDPADTEEFARTLEKTFDEAVTLSGGPESETLPTAKTFSQYVDNVERFLWETG